MSEQDRQNLLEEMAYEITFAYKQAKNIEKDIDKNRESITENSQKIQNYLKKNIQKYSFICHFCKYNCRINYRKFNFRKKVGL